MLTATNTANPFVIDGRVYNVHPVDVSTFPNTCNQQWLMCNRRYWYHIIDGKEYRSQKRLTVVRWMQVCRSALARWWFLEQVTSKNIVV